MGLKFYFELLDKVDEMSFTNHDDKKRFVYIIRRIIKKLNDTSPMHLILKITFAASISIMLHVWHHWQVIKMLRSGFLRRE